MFPVDSPNVGFPISSINIHVLYIQYIVYIYIYGSLLSHYVTLKYQPTIDDMLSHITIISRITLIGKDYNISPLIIIISI